MAIAAQNQPARYWQRFGAVFVDFGLLLLVSVSLGESLEEWFPAEPISMFMTWPILLTLLLLSFFFSLLEYSRLGATPGMLLVGIRSLKPEKPLALLLRRLWLFFSRPLAVVMVCEIFALLLSLSGLVYDQYSIGLGLAFVLFTACHFVTTLSARLFWRKGLKIPHPLVVKGFPPQKLYLAACLLVTATVALALTYPWSLPSYQTRMAQQDSMDDLGAMLAIYASDAGNVYPGSLAELYSASHGPDRAYWKEISNAYTHRTGIGPQGALLDFREFRESPQAAGLILYEPVGAPAGLYHLYAVGPEGRIRRKE